MTSEGPGGTGEINLRSMPPWYRTLFGVDALERFGYYGMQAILVLFAATSHDGGGLGLSNADAASLFGAWVATTFMLSLLGGWLGDRVLGHRPAMQIGCALSVIGYLCLAIPVGGVAAFALCALAIGGGLFKPNHQALYNQMFVGSRGRESGISLMYVATQVSALLAPLAAGYLGERVGWPWGFSLAAVAVLLAGLQLRVFASRFGDVGRRPSRPLPPEQQRTAVHRAGIALGALGAVLAVMALTGTLSATSTIMLTGACSLIAPVFGYVTLYRDPELNAAHRRRLRALLAVFLGGTLFWMIIAHAASLLNLFARDHVDRVVFGFTIPASWMQAATPMFILLLAPAIAWFLPRISTRNNVAVKFGLGLSLVGASFLLMSLAALIASSGDRVSPLWLVGVYLGHAVGEVIIAAVSIAAIAEVLPRQFMGRMMGTYWLFAALGGGAGSGVVRLASVFPEPLYYLGLGSVAALIGVAFFVVRARLTDGLTAEGPGMHLVNETSAR